MNTNHLTEDQIQQTALVEAGEGPLMTGHAAQCEACQNRIRNYRELFSEVKTMPSLSFDFDVAALVREKLPDPRPAFPWRALTLGFAVIILLAAAAIYWGVYLSLIWNGIARLLFYLILPTAAYLFVGQVIILFNNYKKRMNQLKFY